MATHTPDGNISVSFSDIRDAAAAGVITVEEADALIHWLGSQTPAPAVAIETAKGLNLATVAYYFGALLMISACAWFLGDKWQTLGSAGVLATCLIYFALAAALGLWVRGRGYVVGGGLLITVAVCLTPLIAYSVEDLTGLWPAQPPDAYKDYYPQVHGSWIVMELATIVVALAALLRVRFGFLTAPIAFSFWFFSMDIAFYIFAEAAYERNMRAWISVAVGVPTILLGYALGRTLNKPETKSDDFAFWCYLFGLMAFWGGLSAMDSDSELGRFLYLLVNIGLVAISLWLRRSVFLIFGAIGIFIYLGHLAYEVFKDSVLFPFVLVLLGLLIIVSTIFGQKFLRDRWALK